MITKAVTVSGAVGKQVIATDGNAARLVGLNLVAISAAAYVKIRMGNASGDVILEHSAVSNASQPVNLPSPIHFPDGMHVKVLGAGGVCYLFLD